ncbi:hypothetical protein, partial [Streptomyces sp. NPDC094032]|uniref:hypothetical protein n=1 Tax=Streptomyces sp. NPDC094032 TaxID=3155308 RepID=UPI003330A884
VLAFPTLSDLSDPISSVLSGPEFVSFGAFRRVPYFIRSSEPVFPPPGFRTGALWRSAVPVLAEP